MSEHVKMIRSALAQRGWSQVDLATMLGRSNQYVTDILKGKKAMSPSLAVQLEAIFNIPAEEWIAPVLKRLRDNLPEPFTPAALEGRLQTVSAHKAQRQAVHTVAAFKRRGTPLRTLNPEKLRALAELIADE